MHPEVPLSPARELSLTTVFRLGTPQDYTFYYSSPGDLQRAGMGEKGEKIYLCFAKIYENVRLSLAV